MCLAPVLPCLFGVMIDNHEHEEPTKRRVSGLPKEET